MYVNNVQIFENIYTSATFPPSRENHRALTPFPPLEKRDRKKWGNNANNWTGLGRAVENISLRWLRSLIRLFTTVIQWSSAGLPFCNIASSTLALKYLRRKEYSAHFSCEKSGCVYGHCYCVFSVHVYMYVYKNTDLIRRGSVTSNKIGVIFRSIHNSQRHIYPCMCISILA